MAKLITHHDPYHIHKILGVLVLIHYVYRLALVVQYGDAFPTHNNYHHNDNDAQHHRLYAVGGVALHGLLSWSSLLLPLPAKRNFTSPMIWPEFRLHSIAFATRHVITTIMALLFDNISDGDDSDIHDDENRNHNKLWYSSVARAVVVLGTVQAAAMITDRYGDRQRRTTNAMPYPATVQPAQRAAIKHSYMLAQFGATAICLLPDNQDGSHTNASLTFAPLLAIQIAPLMMTMVRKGKVSSGTFHRVYAVSLFLGYCMIFVQLLATNNVPIKVGLHAIFLSAFPSSKLRAKLGFSALAVWTINIVLFMIVYPAVMARYKFDEAVSDQAARSFFWLVTIVKTVQQAVVYAPLFGITTSLRFSMSIVEKEGQQKQEQHTNKVVPSSNRGTNDDFGTAKKVKAH